MPVCKNCHNYVMKLPCSHCGSDLSLNDRKDGEIQPIVPVELQGDFSEPPPPSFASSQSASPPKTQPTISKSDFSSAASPRVTSASSAGGTSELVMSTMDKRFSLIENDLKSIQKELTELNKTQKVIEKVLIQMSKELLKLRKS